jgi:DNA-binding transcriptional MerR regulator
VLVESISGEVMAYTVNKLAKLSSISVRTLHFYDEIGLLKPAYYGENNYRYYEEEQLLMLQQILFYRELGFQLNDIQRIISSPDFDKLKALESHRKILEKNLNQTNILIETVDKTIAHIRGKAKMKDEELYYGFDSEKQKQYEKDLIKSKVVSQEFMDKYKAKISKWTQEDKDHFLEEGKKVNQDLISAIHNKLSPSSHEVQAIIRRHHVWLGWEPTKEKYIGLTQLYQTPEFKKFYDQLHPELLDFIVAAMEVFAERELS